MSHSTQSLFDKSILVPAVGDAFRKLDPAADDQEPGDVCHHGGRGADHRRHFHLPTPNAVLSPNWPSGSGSPCSFANFAEAVAEGRGKAQADSLRKARKDTIARRLRDGAGGSSRRPRNCRRATWWCARRATSIPADGDVVEGIASVDESAITGESAPVIRESGGDRSAVTGGTRVISDRIVIRITCEKGKTFLDRMIAMVEGASARNSQRNRPDHSAGGADFDFPARLRHAQAVRHLLRRRTFTVPVLVALLVCLIPTTIGGLLSAIGISGIDRLIRRNVHGHQRTRGGSRGRHGCADA